MAWKDISCRYCGLVNIHASQQNPIGHVRGFEATDKRSLTMKNWGYVGGIS